MIFHSTIFIFVQKVEGGMKMCSFILTLSPDWMMVWITAIYAIFTCYIMRANNISANLSKEQLEESRKQFEKLQAQNEALKQLNFMPFLQLVRSGDQNEGQYIDEFEIELFCESIEFIQSIYCKIHNIGNGTATDIVYSWSCRQNNRKGSGYPQINAIMHGDDYPIMLELELDNQTPDAFDITIEFEFKDLLGQYYEQRAMLYFEEGDLVRIENDTPKAC